MKKYLIILSLLISIQSFGQFHIPFFGKGRKAEGETSAQYVTRQYLLLNNITGADAVAFKRFTAALEDAGLYYKIAKLTFYKYWTASNRCYNFVAPLAYNGAFTDSVHTGTIATVAGGIELSSGDTINTYWINDLMSAAPNIGAFYYTPTANVDDPLILSLTSPFSMQARFNNKAYVNVWASASGVSVPATGSGFFLGQRIDASTVEWYQGSVKYSESVAVSSPNPTNTTTYIVGNATAPVTLYVQGFCEALTESEVVNLKAIIEQLLEDLGII